MSYLYATLIIRGRYKFTNVPPLLQEEVRQILKDADQEQLAQ
jgi:hypothetical protein